MQSFVPETHHKQIITVYHLIRPYIHQTPVITSSSLNVLSGTSIFFKCENFQKTGSFKARGATSAFLNVYHTQTSVRVATHSSGNFAQAVAYIASKHHTPAYIVMPENAVATKIEAVRTYGAEIIFCKPTLDDREHTLKQVVRQTGATALHPFDSLPTIYGQATIAIELFEQLSLTPEVILVPVGGGGLISGIALWTKYYSPKTKVIGVEPEQVNDAWLSFRSGQRHPPTGKYTIADGLRTSLGQIPFQMMMQLVDDIIMVSETTIIEAMRLIYERLKIVIEPSAAVAFAGLLQHSSLFVGQSVVVVLSGGNVDLDKLPW